MCRFHAQEVLDTRKPFHTDKEHKNTATHTEKLGNQLHDISVAKCMHAYEHTHTYIYTYRIFLLSGSGLVPLLIFAHACVCVCVCACALLHKKCISLFVSMGCESGVHRQTICVREYTHGYHIFVTIINFV